MRWEENSGAYETITQGLTLANGEAQQMSESELERELDRRGQELMRGARTPRSTHPGGRQCGLQVARPGGSRSSRTSAGECTRHPWRDANWVGAARF